MRRDGSAEGLARWLCRRRKVRAALAVAWAFAAGLADAVPAASAVGGEDPFATAAVLDPQVFIREVLARNPDLETGRQVLALADEVLAPLPEGLPADPDTLRLQLRRRANHLFAAYSAASGELALAGERRQQLAGQAAATVAAYGAGRGELDAPLAISLEATHLEHHEEELANRVRVVAVAINACLHRPPLARLPPPAALPAPDIGDLGSGPLMDAALVYRPEVRAARADRGGEASAGLLAAVSERVRAEVAIAALVAMDAAAAVDHHERSLLPAARDRATAARAAYEASRGSLGNVLAAEAAVLAVRRELIVAQGRFLTARADLERAVGAPLAPLGGAGGHTMGRLGGSLEGPGEPPP